MSRRPSRAPVIPIPQEQRRISMPYTLKVYETGALLASTNVAPQPTGAFETFAQAGWAPAAQALGLTIGGIYRMDDPGANGVKRKIKILTVGAGLNAFSYERQGVA
jgi:hypothetical protein